MRRALLLLPLFASAALGQGNPDDEWQPLPNAPALPRPPEPSLPPPPPPPVTPPPPAPTPGFSMRAAEVRPKLRPREAPNTVSMFGAPALGQWKRGQAFVLGFPFFQLRASLGVLDGLDLGLAFDSFYLLMNEVRLSVKYGVGQGPGLSFAFAVEGGAAFFNQRANREVRGPRWISGRRNFNVVPGAILSYQAASARAARLFLDVRYMLTVDTEPFAATPLQGVPAAFLLGHNVLTRVGAELPLSERTAFLFSLGLDVHLRPDDSPVMPAVAIGLVTGI